MRTLGEVLMTVAVAVVLLAVWHAAAGAPNTTPTPVSFSGGPAGVLMVSDEGGGGPNPNGGDRDKKRDDMSRGWHEHDPFAPGGVLGERSPEQHHRDVNRAWGLLGLLVFL